MLLANQFWFHMPASCPCHVMTPWRWRPTWRETSVGTCRIAQIMLQPTRGRSMGVGMKDARLEGNTELIIDPKSG